MAVLLTKTTILKAIKELDVTGRHDLADGGQPGLRLRLTPAGGRTWVLACRDRIGRMRRFPLGGYPDLSISAAREAAKIMRVRVREEGADPIADRRRERAMGCAARAGVGTLTNILDLYTEEVAFGQKHWGEARKRINRVFKPVLHHPAKGLNAGDLRACVGEYARKLSASSASFAVRSIRPALKWAAERELVPGDLAHLSPPQPVTRRTHVLSPDELMRLLPVLRTSGGPYADAIMFMLYTLARRSEVAGVHWRDINMIRRKWTVRETKNGQPHAVPLSQQAVNLLSRIGPSDSDTRVFATAHGGALQNWHRETKALQAASSTEGWTRHDLRRTGATMLGDLGEVPDIIEAALNHVSIRSTLAATYNRSRYYPQVAIALQRLADHLDSIEQN